jgi:hypothetical protein
MKKIYLTLILGISIYLSNAQTSIKPLNDLDFRDSSGTYYKDIDNEMAPFIGTWLHDDGTTQFKVILKKTPQYYNGRYYLDLLVGEYQYVVNGIEKINTLDQIDSAQGFDHRIDGMYNIKSCDIPPSQNCRAGQSRFHLSITDPTENRVAGDLIIHKILHPLNDEIEALIMISAGGTIGENEVMPTPAMPWQKIYKLVRQ